MTTGIESIALSTSGPRKMGNVNASPSPSNASQTSSGGGTAECDKADAVIAMLAGEGMENDTNTKLVEAGDYVLVKQKKKKTGATVA